MSDICICIRVAVPAHIEELAKLRAALWPESSTEEHARELDAMLSGAAKLVMPMIVFVAVDERDVPVGFLEAGLRSCADGCDTSRAVGYLEGWYVKEPYRRQGIGAKLLAAAEDWARRQGCIEMASDTQLHNELSQRVHQAMGYDEVERSVHYRKKL